MLSALLAYSRGFVREAMAIVGWIAAAVLAFLFAPQVEPLVKEVPVIGDFISDSCELSIIAAFAAVFALALIVVSFFTPLFSSLVQRSALGGLDQGVGFLFGVARGILLVAIAFFVYNSVASTQNIEMVDRQPLGPGVRPSEPADRGAKPRTGAWLDHPPVRTACRILRPVEPPPASHIFFPRLTAGIWHRSDTESPLPWCKT